MTHKRAGAQGGGGVREAGSKIGWFSLEFVSSYMVALTHMHMHLCLARMHGYVCGCAGRLL